MQIHIIMQESAVNECISRDMISLVGLSLIDIPIAGDHIVREQAFDMGRSSLERGLGRE